MTTQPTNLLMIKMKMNILMDRTQTQGIIDYDDNNNNTEPGRDI